MKIKLNPKEVLRYAGGGQLAPDPVWAERVEEAIEKAGELIMPRFCYRFFSIERKASGIQVLGTTLLLTGKALKKHLEDAESLVLIAATAGYELERLILKTSKTDLTRSLLLDACGTAAVEEICDQAEEEIRASLPVGSVLTSRFSPGYGDLPLCVQPDFLNVLDAQRRIGLQVTESLILTPRKSVTAVMGVCKKK